MRWNQTKTAFPRIIWSKPLRYYIIKYTSNITLWEDSIGMILINSTIAWQ